VGFFDRLKSGIKNIVSTFREKVEKVIDWAGDKLNDAIQHISNKLGKSSGGSNDARRISEAEELQQALSSLRLHHEIDIKNSEQSCIQIVEDYYDSYIDLFQTISKNNNINLDTSRLSQYKKAIGKAISGKLDANMKKRLNIDDPECRLILKMSAGDSKINRFVKYQKDVINDAMLMLQDDIDAMLKNQGEIIEEYLTEQFEMEKRRLESSAAALTDIQKNMQDENFDRQILLVEPMQTIITSEYVLAELE
jgi:hypothetical protein